MKEFPTDVVIRFGKVNLDSKKPYFLLGPMHNVHDFLRHNDIFMDTSLMNETKLVRGDNVVHVMLKSVGNNFAEDFIYRIAEGNRFKLSNNLKILQFGNKINISEVYINQGNFLLPDLMNEGGDVLTCMLPDFLIEIRWKTVRTSVRLKT